MKPIHLHLQHIILLPLICPCLPPPPTLLTVLEGECDLLNGLEWWKLHTHYTTSGLIYRCCSSCILRCDTKKLSLIRRRKMLLIRGNKGGLIMNSYSSAAACVPKMLLLIEMILQKVQRGARIIILLQSVMLSFFFLPQLKVHIFQGGWRPLDLQI